MHQHGVAFGRFQPIHKGHIEHLLTAKANCKHLYVGITNSDFSMIKEDEANKERSKLINNPFTYYERSKMIENLLVSLSIPHDEFTIVPFPLQNQPLIKCYCPLDAVFMISIYEQWGIRKKEILESYGFNVLVMFDHPDAEREISGSKIRTLIQKNDNSWKEKLPESTLKILKTINLQERFNYL